VNCDQNDTPTSTDSADDGGGNPSEFPCPILVNPWFLAAVTTVLGLIAALTTTTYDEALWGYCGWLWSVHGEPPYIGAFENKPAGIFLLYRFSWSVFGAPAPVGIVNRLASGGTVLMLYMTGRRLKGWIAAVFSALIFGLYSINRATDGTFWVRTETFMLFFTAVGLYLVVKIYSEPPSGARRAYAFGAGLALGAALNFKQIAIMDVVGLAPLLFLAVRRGSSNAGAARDIGMVLFGGLTITALEFAPLAASGVTLRDYWRAVVESLFLLRGHQSIVSHARSFLANWTQGPLVLCLPLVLAFLVNKRSLQRSKVPFWSLLFWLGMAFVGANASADMYPHQLRQAMLPLSVVAGLGISCLAQTLYRYGPKVLLWLYVSLVVLLVPYIDLIEVAADYLVPLGLNRPETSDRASERRVVEYIQSQTDPSDFIYIWYPKGSIKFYAQRRCSSRYFVPDFRFMPDFEALITEDLAARPPKIVLINDEPNVAPPPPSCLRKLLDTNYTPSSRIHYYTVYRRKP
jgi:hypothetical protein